MRKTIVNRNHRSATSVINRVISSPLLDARICGTPIVKNGRAAFRPNTRCASFVTALAIAFCPGNNALAQQSPAPAAAASPITPVNEPIAEIVVTGSRLSNANFTAPTPVQVMRSETIELRAPSNIADVINELPAFRISHTDAGAGRVADQQSGVQSLLDLRGLGDVRTLVLVNGHRHVGTVASGSFDTKMIPVGLVDRVEVVTGGASAAYGSDAVAGVTNILLKNHLEGIQGSAQAGETEYQDGRDLVGSLAGGFAFGEQNRGHVVLGGDAEKNSGVGNIYTRPYGRVEPGLISRTVAAGRPPGEAASVFVNGVEIGTQTPGSLITTPLGGHLYSFDAAGNPMVFNQGTRYGANMVGNTANYGNNPNGKFQLENANSREVAFGRAEYQITHDWTIYTEINYGHTHLPPQITNDYTTNFRVAATNPFLPASLSALIPAATTSIPIGRIDTDFGGNTVWQTNHSTSAVIGGEADVNDWKIEAYYQHGSTHQDFNTSGLVLPALYRAVYGCDNTAANPNLTAALRAQLALYESLSGKTCAVFNPFGVGQGQAAAYNYFLADQHQTSDFGKDVVAINVSGSPLSDWAGEVSLAAGAEYRRDTLNVVADTLPLANLFTQGNFTSYGGSNTVKEGFGEVGVPLLRKAPLAEALDFNAAARRTDYKLSGAVTTWKIGLTDNLIDTVRLRATRSRDIRAPNLNELFFVGGAAVPSTVTNTIPGIFGSGATGAVGNAGQGYRGLVPEIADTFTAGIVLGPVFGFHGSLDYYRVKVNRAIVRLTSQQTVNQCAAGVTSACAAITFDPTTPVGISFIVNQSSNVNSLLVSGFDLEAGYRARSLPWGIPGSFDVTVLFNKVVHNSITSSLSGMTTENAGSSTGTPEWTGNVTFGYQIGPFSADLQFRGFTHVKYDPTLQGPDDPNYNVAAANSINVQRFVGEVYTNLTLQYEITKNLKVFGIVNNIADIQPPPYAIIAITTPGRQLNYDLLGREFKVGMRFSFL